MATDVIASEGVDGGCVGVQFLFLFYCNVAKDGSVLLLTSVVRTGYREVCVI
jgi:hypothetical protein